MSMQLMVSAMKARVGSPMRKLVLIKLADNANDDGECWPSYRHIAEQCETGRATVKRHIKGLQEAGFVSVEWRNDGKSSNLFRLHFDGQTVVTVNRGHSEPGSERYQTGVTVIPDGGHSDPQNQSGNQSKNQSGGRQRQNRRPPVSCPPDVSADTWSDFLDYRRGKDATLSETAWKRMRRDLDALKAEGWNPDDVLAETMAAGWRAFKAEWIRNRCGKPNNNEGQYGQYGSLADKL